MYWASEDACEVPALLRFSWSVPPTPLPLRVSIRVAAPQLITDGRYAMGTVLELAVVSRDATAAREWLDGAPPEYFPLSCAR